MSVENRSEATYEISAQGEHFVPYEHQIAAWDAMTNHFEFGQLDRPGTAAPEEARCGMLVVPTGGGKTAIAARWLLRHHLREGGRVLWFAHRRSLLRQAFETFARARSEALPKESLSQIIISSKDMRWSNVAPHHDVVFSSVMTACRDENMGFLAQMRTQSPKGLFVVVDEAHHAAAQSYRKVLGRMLELGCPLLGLSATPVRMDRDDELRLWKMFKSIIYQVSKQSLIDKRILATPRPVTVQTKVEFEREFTDDDVRHLERYGELAPRVLQRIAKHGGRNKLIVDHYLAHRAKYGKTLLFAADTLHAQTLAKEFSDHGVDADYVDYSRNENAEVIRSYDKEPTPVVLANVEMLTEGVDLPRTQTVFIVRPTRSEALLSQIIGRALRGRAAGGTDEAFLVTFVDTWKDFHPLDTEFVVKSGEPEDPGLAERLPRQLLPISDTLIFEAYKLVRSNVRGTFEGTYECLPHSWYRWEAEYEDDIQVRPLMVFENQAAGYQALLEHFADTSQIPEEISEVRARELVRTFFGDCPDPLPSWMDVAELLLAKRKGAHIQSYTFEEKRRFDPHLLARDIRERNLGDLDKERMLSELFDGDAACQFAYQGDKEAFFEDVDRELLRLRDVAPPPPPKLVEIVPEDPRPWPEGERGYDLVQIWETIAAADRHFRGKPPVVRDIRYMDKPSKRYFGFCRLPEATIHINPVLNSPDVPRFVMEYLVYHEALHAHMPTAGHNRDFRAAERRFVPSEEAVLEAHARGFQPAEVADGWRLLADQFFDTFHIKYRMVPSSKTERM